MFKCCKKKNTGKESYTIPEIITLKDDFTDFEMDVLELINEHRYKKGLSMLEFHMKLANIALVHTNYMVLQGKANHDNFPIRNAQAVKYCGASYLGENVAYGYGTPEGFVGKEPYKNKYGKMVYIGWLGSKGHRKIIESDKAIFFAVSIIPDIKNRNFGTFLVID